MKKSKDKKVELDDNINLINLGEELDRSRKYIDKFLKLLKTDTNNNALTGAEFKITLPDGTEKTAKTNSEGIITIDRINVDGNYEPSNCRWVDAKIQRSNQRPRKRNCK